MQDKPNDGRTAAGRDPDNVTVVSRGNNVLTVYGYYKEGEGETAVDKMERALRTEAALGGTDDCA